MLKKLMVLVSAGLMLMVATGVQAVTLTASADVPVSTTTAVGKGADTTLENDAQSGNHGPASLHGTEASLTVRRFDGTRQKMLYLRWDLSSTGGHLAQATLTFNVTSTANRARVWAIYGLTDETLDNWDEATICYNNAPGMLPAAIAAYAIDPAKLRRLCTMNVGATAGIYTSTVDPNMDKFLSEDTNGLVSFLVIPNTTDTTATWYVSSKEATTLAPNLVPTITGVVVNATRASVPTPADKVTGISRDAVLSWRPSENAHTFNVYLSRDQAAVSAAQASVLVSQGQDANSYDPPGHLDFNTWYYWRVDEVGGAPDFAVSPGVVWSFQVEMMGRPITNVTATASSTSAGDPQNTINNAGLTLNPTDPNQDAHGVVDTTMWLSDKTTPIWIMYQFDKIYKLHQMWVWNYNTITEGTFGTGAKEVTIEYSTDGSDWTVLRQAEIFQQAPGSDKYVHNTTVPFGGVAAKYVRLTIQSNWGKLVPQCGLSEVRFFQIPVQAAQPVPASAATNIDPRALVLSWKAGREAASHKVYLGTDQQTVTNGTAPVVTVNQATYVPPAPLLGTTYYWKVVEVNDAMTPPSWDSDVWSFSTAQTLPVDTFESYTDQTGLAVFETWIDGYDNPTKNGAIVGLKDPLNGTFCSTSIFHGGRQSMPLAYNNAGGAVYSEAVRTFTDPQDWSQSGITTLVLWFRGDPNNAPAPLYVKINSTKVLFNSGAPSTAISLWKQWNIDLTSLGATVKSVKTLTIGVGDGKAGGAGTIYIDDILLYATAPQVVTPVDPGAGGLIALYAMEGNVQDTSGKGNHGTALGNPVYVNSLSGFGKALKFDGLDDYVALPLGSALSTMSNITVATRINFTGAAGAWQRAFDFGTDTTTYMFLTPSQSGTTASRFAIRTAAVAEQGVNAPTPLSVGWHHLAVTISSATMTITLYVDGTAVGSGATVLLPKDLGVTTQNWIGRSQWPADAFLNSTLDDFRIYNVALTEGQVRYLAGDR
jgi:hypothetical protein